MFKRENYVSWLKGYGLHRLCDENGRTVGARFITGFIQYWSLIHNAKIPAILVALRNPNDDTELTCMRVLQTHFIDVLNEYREIGIFEEPITSTEFSNDFIKPEEVKDKFLVILDPLEENEDKIADICRQANVPEGFSLQLFVFGTTEQPLL